MREIFCKEILKLMKKDKDIIFIIGDCGWQFNKIKETFPDRYFNVGICEQSMVSMASGLALQGLKPIIFTITPFLIERAFEQIKIDIDSMNLKVMLVGFADYPKQGITHQEINGKKLMSLFENIESLFPEDKKMLIHYINHCYEKEGPTFLSLKKLK